ncbi:diaminohydroxyphosphoribosylaminopyrimidine deaminase [Marinospirillum alkaliphilum DSM 21637]|uniref:Riboflavin biosynthesis protein RibD n=2 Tax=Marinospirillum TaxID=64968 RepID=A0A1K1V3L6_9GAMM|nr:bifunctional diaminohydroxyphosphoribosylaminopyrimidine deaminase/5-amino-6-(5-phosphoribosylamino)uracil reductase RibD [Marinospirillum alkaliphilum]SFX19722.1 diaminohydroxyphosphoribosylaminopyrimidine deaminase [Marinospirillum alkaliphilum DSM 21637]
MALAIRLARQGWYTTRPNPRVGCVLVRDGQLVGQGAHLKAGEAHAEVHALRQAGALAQGADAYVTLEPCSHHGRTPPCADALIAAGVRRVCIAQLDSNPLVAGRGVQKLRDAGIEVAHGLLEADARALNPGFFRRMETGLPRVTLKLAMSLDGRTAMASGESQWITGAEARQDVQRLRAASCAIITGADSVLVDDSRLTVRDKQLTGLYGFSQPLRVITDSRLRVPAAAAIFRQPGTTLLATREASVGARPQQAEQLRQAGAELLVQPGAASPLNLQRLLSDLAERGCNEVLVEAGASLAGAFLQAGLVQELRIYMAPMLLGDTARGLLQLPGLERLADAIHLKVLDIRALGQDWRFILEPQGLS